MAVRTILFDFDGTLVDTFSAALEIANRIAPEFGYRRIEPHEVETMRGWAYGQIVEHLGVSWRKLPAIASRIRGELTQHLDRLAPVDGLPEVLSSLRGRGFELGILTSNTRDNVTRFLAAHAIEDFAFLNASSSIWGKRHRLRTILKRRKRSADEVAYVGDEVRDIEAAQALGLHMVAVAWGYSRRELLASHSPGHLIERPAQLLELFAD